MLTPYPGVIDAYTVTTRVNTPKMGPGTDSAAETFSSSTAGTKVSRGLAPISLAGWARLALNNQPLRLPASAGITPGESGSRSPPLTDYLHADGRYYAATVPLWQFHIMRL